MSIIEINSDEDWDNVPAEKHWHDVTLQVYLRINAENIEEAERIADWEIEHKVSKDAYFDVSFLGDELIDIECFECETEE